MRKVFSSTIATMLVLGGMALLGAPHQALALTNDTSVVNSGDNATVNSSSSQNSTVTVNNSNTADISQSVNASANTGGNDANRNIGGASINTGSAGITANLGAAANSNTTVIGGTGIAPSSTNTTDVVNTGDNTRVDTNTNTNSSVNVNNTNAAYVDQSCGGGLVGIPSLERVNGIGGGCNANTGGNDANRNIGGASITTGNAGVTANFGVDVNKNRTLVGGVMGGSPSLTNSAVITNTGDNAYVHANANSNSSVDVNNLNEALISQSVFGHVNSGYNDANRNIGGASVNTGSAGMLVNMGIRANSNLTGIGSSMDPLSHNLLDVVNTGDDLTTNVNTNVNTNDLVNNTNDLRGQQYSFLHSNSGHSYARRDIGYSTVYSGNSGIGSNFGVEGNTNATFIGGLMDALLGWMGWM